MKSTEPITASKIQPTPAGSTAPTSPTVATGFSATRSLTTGSGTRTAGMISSSMLLERRRRQRRRQQQRRRRQRRQPSSRFLQAARPSLTWSRVWKPKDPRPPKRAARTRSASTTRTASRLSASATTAATATPTAASTASATTKEL